jgi:hypothetical protein
MKTKKPVKQEQAPKQHEKPCRDCPWRRTAPPGWLGAVQTPEDWIETARGEVMVDCHTCSAQCAGMAIFRANILKSPRFAQILRLPADRELVFATTLEFIQHHRRFGVVSSELEKGGGKLWRGK